MTVKISRTAFLKTVRDILCLPVTPMPGQRMKADIFESTATQSAVDRKFKARLEIIKTLERDH
jgi:hypothetical protein